MSIPEMCERIQDTWLSQAISQSTWGYPVVGALHILAIALFGGAVLVTNVSAFEFTPRSQVLRQLALDVRWLKRAGLTLVLATGTLLFSSGAVQYCNSTFFRIKVMLLVLLLFNELERGRRSRNAANLPAFQASPSRMHSAISLALWVALIFASRGIAFL